MTIRYLRILRTIFVSLIALAIALVPFTSAVAQTTIYDRPAQSGLEAQDASTQPDEVGRITKIKTYARAGYIWPFSSGPSYGANIDRSQTDIFIATSGAFELRKPLDLPQELRTANELDRVESQHFVLQWHPDLTTPDNLELTIEAAGGQVVDYFDGRTMIARLSAQALTSVQSSIGLTAITPYQAGFKISPKVGRTPLANPIKALSDVYELEVQLWAGQDALRTADAITELGGTVLRSTSDTLIVELHRSQLARLAAIDSVKAIHENIAIFPLAEETTTTMQTGNYNGGAIPYHDAGVNGSGGASAFGPQVLMVLDSGISLDAGDLSDERTVAGPAGPGHRKVIVYESTTQFGGQGDTEGCDAPPQGGFSHGHVVASTALGNASDVGPEYNGAGWIAFDQFNNAWKIDGVAPGAKLVAYDGQITPPNGSCSDPLLDGIFPGDLWDGGTVGPCPGANCPGSLVIAYNDHDARVTNFSWGSNTNSYTSNAGDIDSFLFFTPDAMVFVSAGNAGADDLPDGGDGIPDEETLGTPATTKNGLAIGASRNANTVNSPESREFFSSMGPAVSTTINRIAPQLMAPGGEPGAGSLGISSEFSCRSDDNNQDAPVLCDIISGVEGTSFSSPAAAGAAMLVRDYFAQGFYPDAVPNPADEAYVSGGLVKATLIASADFMTGANLTRGWRFNNEQGYGRIQLDNALPLETWPDSPTGLIVHDPSIGGISDLSLASAIDNTVTTSSAPFEVCDDTQELRVALGWIDRPGSALTNDLNLTLISPSGVEYRGNYFTDDVDKSGVIDPAEDCGSIGAANADDPNAEIDEGQWSLPVCGNTAIEGKNLSPQPFDNSNPTEAIFLSPNPDGDVDPNGDPILNEGTCIPGSDLDGQACGNNLDCMSGPPTCSAGAGACVCENVDAYEQPELGEWTITVARGPNSILGSQPFSVVIAGGVCLGSSVRFDRGSYTCNNSATVTVQEFVELGAAGPDDCDPGVPLVPCDNPDEATVSARTTVEVLDADGMVVDVETNLNFTKDPAGAKFVSDLLQATDGTARDPGNGALDVRSGDSIRVIYNDIDVDTGATVTRTNVGSINCEVGVGFGSIVFFQFGQDDNVLVQGGCERNARGQFEFGFPDRYMDADETIIYNFAFNSDESIDLDNVIASLRCVNPDVDSPADCLPNGDNCDDAACGGTCDPRRENNAPCGNANGEYMSILDSPKGVGFVPAGAAMSANFSLQMAGDGAGEPFGLSGFETPDVEMLLEVTASVSGKTSTGIAVNQHTLNVDEVSKFYSTDYPMGGSEVVDAGPGTVGNNDEIASDPITELGNFQTNDYRFETKNYEDLTDGGTKNLNLLSPWNFDGNNGGFTVGLAGPTDETAADIFNIANWGEDKNFNGIEDGICTADPATACYIFGVGTDPRCPAATECATVEDNKSNSTFDQHWSTSGGCGWQTKASNACSNDPTHTCFTNDDCAGFCEVPGNAAASTLEPCGVAVGPCPAAGQCSDTIPNPKVLQACTVDADCFNDGDVVQPGACEFVSQSCSNDDGLCNQPNSLGTGGVWHTGEIGTTNLACTGGAGSACANYKTIAGGGGQLLWWELLVTPIMEQVDTSGASKIEILDWAWNTNLNLSDFNAAYSWELDTDTETLDPLDLFADTTILGIGSGGYGAVAATGNPDLTRGFPTFAAQGSCNANGAPCESTTDCATGLCQGDGTTACHFDADCTAAGTSGPCNGADVCNPGSVSVNGSLGGSREGDAGCFFEGNVPPEFLTELGLARPTDDDLDNDGDTFVDEFVQPDGPYRNHDVVAFNGPDMRFFTLEDIYGDTAETFQAALGFINFEGTPAAQATQSYGVAVDDMVVSWREFLLDLDATDCATSGSCAIIELATSNVFEGQTSLTVTVFETTPPTENDCDLDDNPDGTDDCDNNGTKDLVVRASSESEQPGEILFVNQDAVEPNNYVGTLSISTLGDSPGVLFIEQAGSEAPTVTVTYFDDDSDPVTGGDQPCPSDVDPTKHGLVQSFTTVFVGSFCDVTIVGSVSEDNGDGDFYADTAEILDMQITYINNCGIELNNCTARLFSNSPEVDCILDSVINLGNLDDEGGIQLSSEAFRWKVGDDVNRTDVDQPLTAEFNVTVTCDEIDSLATPQGLIVPLDLNLDLGGQDPVAWEEGFEDDTLGKFEAENLDAGIPGANNAEGLLNGDGYRCQYSDPDWPNSNSYGDDISLDCYPGQTLAQADAVFWQADGPGLNLCDGGRAHTGANSMYYGICLTDPAGVFTSPLATIESVATSDPINLGDGFVGPTGLTLELNWWHQVSLTDGTFLNVTPLRSADAGVVQYKTVSSGGADTSDWTNLNVFQNSYDAQRYDFYFNCMFDPVDDGNTEDTFFDPSDPNRRLGPSSTCFPETRFVRLGDTDEPYMEDNIGRATTPPGAAGEGDLGLGTWVQSRVDLVPLAGRRIKLRYLVSAIKATAENHEDQFTNMQGQWYDDGWWIDDLFIDESLTNPATFTLDSADVGGCTGDPEQGCLVDQDCVDSGAGGTCTLENPGCGDTCETAGGDALTVVISTFPDNNGGAADELLSAPGQAIEIDASGSTGKCLNGSLQYRFSKGGQILRDFSENPIYVDAPQVDTDYTVDLRCSTDPSAPNFVCDAGGVVDVNVDCPSSGNLGFGNPQMVATSNTTFEWPASFLVEAIRGNLNTLKAASGTTGNFSTSVDACVLDNVDTDTMVDATVPVPSGGPGLPTGLYWLVKPVDEACNILNGGSWSFGAASEVAGRDATIPSDPQTCM